MRWLAHLVNELGGVAQDRGRLRAASALYVAASRLEPAWDAPWFNRGLIAKCRRAWPECIRHTLRAAELDPAFVPAWWNLGIAATATSDWALARRAWWRCGIEVPPGDGPPVMRLGPVPVRLDPQGAAEVVWCDRIDPARAVIRSVPLPASGRGHGDTVLHDGEPRGRRQLAGQEIPVFNELELLVASALRTFEATVTAPGEQAARHLEDMAHEGVGAAEDWSSSLEVLCASCSEGTPHERHDAEPGAWRTERRFGIAATSPEQAAALLERWAAAGQGREVRSLACVLERREA